MITSRFFRTLFLALVMVLPLGAAAVAQESGEEVFVYNVGERNYLTGEGVEVVDSFSRASTSIPPAVPSNPEPQRRISRPRSTILKMNGACRRFTCTST